MSSLGQWFFEKEKQSILAAIRDRAPYVATVAEASAEYKTVNIIDPYTGATENELLTVLGPAPKAGDSVMVLQLVDGERVAMALRGFDRNFAQAGSHAGSMALGSGATVTGRGQAVGTAAEAADASTAVGYLAKALGSVAQAFGYNAQAAGDYNIAMGYNSSAASVRSIAIGHLASALLEGGIGIGYSTIPGRLAVALGYEAGQGAQTGELSVSIGYWASATATNATAVGRQATASAIFATAMGYAPTASGQYSLAAGYTATASGLRAVALGHNAAAAYQDSIGIGTNAVAPGSTQGHIAVVRLHVYAGASSSGLVIKSSDGSQWMITVGNTGTLTTTKL